MNGGQRQILDYDPVTRPAAGRRRLASDEEGAANSTATESWPLKAEHSIADDAGVADDAAGANSSAGAQLSPRGAVKEHGWLLKHGHSFTYGGLFLFTIVLYFRPYEFYPSPLTASIAFALGLLMLAVFVPSQLMLEGTLTTRPREVNLALLLCLAGLLSIPLAIEPRLAWDQWSDAFLKAIVIFVVMVNVVRTERRLRGMLFLVLAVSFVLSVGAINDHLSGRVPVEGYRVAGIIGGIFGNPNDLALHLQTMVPISVALLFATRNPVSKALYAGLTVLMLGGIVVTFSRTGFLGLVCATTILGWKLGRRNRFTLIVLLVLCFVLFFALAPGEYSTRVLSIFDSSKDRTGSFFSREALLLKSLSAAANNPVFGIGMGNFRIISIREAVNHNAYLQVMTEIGLAALILYVLFMVTPLKRLRRIEREMFAAGRPYPSIYYLVIGVQASIVGYMVASFFSSVAYQWYIYYLVAYAVCLRRIYQAKCEKGELAGGKVTNEAKEKALAAPSFNELEVAGGGQQ
ncbi:MAG: O-antigen ligase family protein [Pyrinomonadaceae bacterium]